MPPGIFVGNGKGVRKRSEIYKESLINISKECMVKSISAQNYFFTSI
jgi:hypothetical protein